MAALTSSGLDTSHVQRQSKAIHTHKLHSDLQAYANMLFKVLSKNNHFGGSILEFYNYGNINCYV